MRKHWSLVLVPLALALAPASEAAMAKTYQVTGPVTSVTSDEIVVLKGKDKWEIRRDAGTKAASEPKVGDKVTVEYRMDATSIDVKSPTKTK